MRPVALAALLAACAAPQMASVDAVVAPAPRASRYVDHLAQRFRDERVSLGGWPVRASLPRSEACYDAAFLLEDGACDGWSYDLLVDVESPRIVWVRRTGTIVGDVRDYLGPAEILDDSGLLTFRAGE